MDDKSQSFAVYGNLLLSKPPLWQHTGAISPYIFPSHPHAEHVWGKSTAIQNVKLADSLPKLTPVLFGTPGKLPALSLLGLPLVGLVAVSCRPPNQIFKKKGKGNNNGEQIELAPFNLCTTPYLQQLLLGEPI